jgi:TldD protein
MLLRAYEEAVAKGQMEKLLGPEDLRKIVAVALSRGGDFADVYVEWRGSTDIQLRESTVQSVRYGVSQGIGIRVIKGDASGYAYVDEFDLKKATGAAKVASQVAREGKRGIALVKPREAPKFVTFEVPLHEVPEKEKVQLLRRADEAARAFDARIHQVGVSYVDERKIIKVANSEGLFVEDELPLVWLTVDALAVEGSMRHGGYVRGSERRGFEFFTKRKPEDLGREAARQAVVMLGAKDTPAGETTVVMENGWGGVLFHEAVGHGLEADGVQRGTSFYSGKKGQQVASELVTLIDDATISGMRGSFNVDDEGTAAQRKVLIEKGVIRDYMYDLLSARQLGATSTGNGRRESYRNYPLVRMTNTFIMAGGDDPQDIIKDTRKGVYAARLAGGVVDTTSGNFTFTVREAYLIEDGKLTSPVRGGTLIGNGPEILTRIDRVGRDLELAPGTCGKGQWVPVTSGQPTLRISRMTVGGTA